MTQPRHIDISSSIPDSCHDAITAAIALAARLIDVDLSETEVHVKQSSRPAHGWYGSSSAFSGMAYFWYTPDRKPGALAPQGKGIVRVQPGTRYLVTMKLTNGFTHGKYPFLWQYRRYKTAAAIELRNWQEELLHLAAHEFVHIKQYALHATRSEIECEFLAHQAVLRYRQLIAQSSPSPVGKAARKGG